mmetsp:Transcript_25215/g.77726  ORF Transcript_25215/g.77726 Transcript_25215/m.77726 type:complete len:479 (+) Transcript_25215:197-1633(+)
MVQGVAVESGCLVNTNPATGAIIEKVKMSRTKDVDAAVEAAAAAQRSWVTKSLDERTALVKAAARALAEDRAGLTKMITMEMGKVISEAEEEVDGMVAKDEYCDLVAKANEPEIHAGNSVIVRHPHGVVAVCAPWNYPVEEIVLLCIPALIAGNTVVVKPSEVAPLSGGMAVAAMQTALPPGVVNLVQGDGSVGSYLVSHAGVAMVGFTGSTAVGSKILEAASKTLKPVVLECGGKDPMIVFADADLDLAAKEAVAFSLANCGQVCCAVERVYVASDVAEAFEKKCVELAKTYTHGDGLDPASKIGPLASEMQRAKVHSHVVAATKAGANLLLGGELPKGDGNFYPPTVLGSVPHAANMEETFGPVVALSPFDGSDDSAVKLANDSTYGLTASVYSTDLARAGLVASRISAGQVGVNCNPFAGGGAIQCPFVGHKQSGYNSHSGVDGWRAFSTPKSLIYSAPPPAEDLPPAAKKARAE